MKTIFLSICFLILAPLALADGDHSAPATSDGAAKLLEDGEFTLAPKAEKRMGIEWMTLKGNGPWKVPADSLVKIKFITAAYRKFEGRITLVVLTETRKEGNVVIISSPDLADGDLLAIKGVKYLRLAEVDISSGTVDNCSH